MLLCVIAIVSLFWLIVFVLDNETKYVRNLRITTFLIQNKILHYLKDFRKKNLRNINKTEVMTLETNILYKIAWNSGQLGFEKNIFTLFYLLWSVILQKFSYLNLELYIVALQMIHLILFDPLYPDGKIFLKNMNW